MTKRLQQIRKEVSMMIANLEGVRSDIKELNFAEVDALIDLVGTAQATMDDVHTKLEIVLSTEGGDK
jgi:hypothetical protein